MSDDERHPFGRVRHEPTHGFCSVCGAVWPCHGAEPDGGAAGEVSMAGASAAGAARS